MFFNLGWVGITWGVRDFWVDPTRYAICNDIYDKTSSYWVVGKTEDKAILSVSTRTYSIINYVHPGPKQTISLLGHEMSMELSQGTTITWRLSRSYKLEIEIAYATDQVPSQLSPMLTSRPIITSSADESTEPITFLLVAALAGLEIETLPTGCPQ